MRFLFLVTAVSVILSGCATVFQGTEQDVHMYSAPQGARVFVDGTEVGTTPMQLKLNSRKTHVIQFRKEGFETKAIILNASVGGGWILLDAVVGPLWPIVVDAITGAWYGLDETTVEANLSR